MSYEGYERVLCRNGHLATVDCYNSDFGPDWRCGVCGEPRCWREGVDQTNDAGIETHLVVHQERVIETCDKCGHGREVAPPRYCIPGEPDDQNPSVMKTITPVPLVPVVRCGFTVLETSEHFDTEDEAYRRHVELYYEREARHQQSLRELGLARELETT